MGREGWGPPMLDFHGRKWSPDLQVRWIAKTEMIRDCVEPSTLSTHIRDSVTKTLGVSNFMASSLTKLLY